LERIEGAHLPLPAFPCYRGDEEALAHPIDDGVTKVVFGFVAADRNDLMMMMMMFLKMYHFKT
jgi:hypothetical protein